MRAAVMGVVVMLVTSCGAEQGLQLALPGVAGCDFRGGSVNGAEGRCQERNMVAVEWFRIGCKLSGGEPLDAECPREGILAGCLLEGSNPMQVATDWYYAKLKDGSDADIVDRDGVERQCESDGQLVDP